MSEKLEKISIENISELLKRTKTDDGTFCSTIYDLYVLINIAKGVESINKGNHITLKELEAEMEAIYESSNRRFS